MSQQYVVAIAGATGAVGVEMIRTLEQRRFPVKKLKLLASERSVGKKMKFNGSDVTVEVLSDTSFKGVELALFSAGAERSRIFAPAAVSAGAVVVDNSSAFRMDDTVPLVIPEVNPQDLEQHHGLIANPNCSSIQVLVALKPLHDRARITRVVVSTYQAAAGAGKNGLDELTRQTREILEHGACSPPRTFQYQLAFNLIPQIDVFQEGGYTKEEWKMVHETAKIMGDPGIRVTATTVRVPVLIGHSESVNVETERKLTAEEAREILRHAPGVTVVDDPSARTYPMPAPLAGTDGVFVGRIREDNSIERGLNLWIVADNVRKGAALNAVQIAERLVAGDLVRVP